MSFFFPSHHRDILKSGGTAVDAAIAGLICTSVMNPQSSGLGGGVIFTIYNASTGMASPWCLVPLQTHKSESCLLSQSNILNIKSYITKQTCALNPKHPAQGAGIVISQQEMCVEERALIENELSLPLLPPPKPSQSLTAGCSQV